MSDSSWDRMILTGAEFEPIGPAIADIVVHLDMSERTGQLRHFGILLPQPFQFRTFCGCCFRHECQTGGWKASTNKNPPSDGGGMMHRRSVRWNSL